MPLLFLFYQVSVGCALFGIEAANRMENCIFEFECKDIELKGS